MYEILRKFNMSLGIINAIEALCQIPHGAFMLGDEISNGFSIQV